MLEEHKTPIEGIF